MVRAHQKQASEDKKETTIKKKAPQKKKPVETGVWPCKINGCNKQFAREADLKRHQRTTKLHSVPGFACPQCDATFTRTDALRRHQKSRHNGVIIEPPETDKSKEGNAEAGSSGSKTNSRSGTPSKNGGTGIVSTAGPSAGPPDNAGPASGLGNYYREHTMENTFTHYPPGVGLPTSATRLHQATWPGGHPWDGTPGMGPITYHPSVPPGHLTHQRSYYRVGVNLIPRFVMPPMTPAQLQGIESLTPEQIAGMERLRAVSQNGPPAPPTDPSRTGTPIPGQPAVDPSLSHSEPNGNHRAGIDMSEHGTRPMGENAAPVIDPSLDAATSTTAPSSQSAEANDKGAATSVANGDTEEGVNAISFAITQAAVEAVLQSAQRESSLASTPRHPASPEVRDEQEAGSNNGRDGSAPIAPDALTSGASSTVEGNGINDGDCHDTKQIATTSVSQERQSDESHFNSSMTEQMDHMMSEDDTPMLKPEELLTQESLASPPPS